jgi:Protein of unknown function (DUF2001).
MPLAYDRIPINGKEGTVTAVIDGNVVELAEIKTLTGTIEFENVKYNVLGDRATRHKNANWTGTGSCTYHWVSPRFVKMVIDAANSGKFPYFDITVTNDDPGSSAGRQTIKLGQVSINGSDIAVIDIDETMLEGSFDFTFSQVSGLEYFGEL